MGNPRVHTKLTTTEQGEVIAKRAEDVLLDDDAEGGLLVEDLVKDIAKGGVAEIVEDIEERILAVDSVDATWILEGQLIGGS